MSPFDRLSDLTMSIDDRLQDIRTHLAETGDPFGDLKSFENWCAKLRSLVGETFPARMPELDRLFTALPGIALVPRLARRPKSKGSTSELPAPAVNGQQLRSRLLDFIATLRPPKAEPPPQATTTPIGPRTSWKPTPWVFISSLGEGAEEYRASARSACLRKRMLPIGMESWSAVARSPAEVCRDYVQDCDVMILILLHRYGSIEPTSGKSYTELEYEAARAAQKKVLAFEVTSVPGLEPLRLDLDDLRRLQEFSAALSPQVRKRVATADQLEVAVFQALDEWQGQFDRVPRD